MQDAGARRVGNVEGMRGIVRKHDCALPAQYTKHSNARGHSFRFRRVKTFSKIGLQFRYYRVLSKALLGFSVPDNQPSMTAHYKIFLNN